MTHDQNVLVLHHNKQVTKRHLDVDVFADGQTKGIRSEGKTDRQADIMHHVFPSSASSFSSAATVADVSRQTDKQ